MKIKKHNHGKKKYPLWAEYSRTGFKSLVAGLGIGLAVLGCKDSGSKEVANDKQHKNEKRDKNKYPVRTSGVIRRPKINRDSDGDGIGDYKDKCPHRPETYNNYQDKDGCPDTPGQIEDGKIDKDEDQDGKVIKVLNTGNPATKPPEPPVKPPEPPTKPPEPLVKPPEPPVKPPPNLIMRPPRPPKGTVRRRGRPRMPRKPKNSP
jgi:hypothetical protein